jgi:hypothetical protein
MRAFNEAVQNPVAYGRIVGAMHIFYNVHTGRAQLTLNDCISKVVEQFFDKAYFSVMTAERRSSSLQQILKDTLVRFSVTVNEGGPILQSISGPDAGKSVVGLMQDKFKDELQLTRERIMIKIANAERGESPTDAAIMGKLKQNLYLQTVEMVRQKRRIADLETRLAAAEDADADVGASDQKRGELEQLVDRLTRDNDRLVRELMDVRGKLHEVTIRAVTPAAPPPRAPRQRAPPAQPRAPAQEPPDMLADPYMYVPQPRPPAAQPAPASFDSDSLFFSMSQPGEPEQELVTQELVDIA